MGWTGCNHVAFLAAVTHILGYDRNHEAWRHAILNDATRAKLLELVYKHPGINETELAEKSGGTRSGTRYHLTLLLDGDWVRKKRVGRENHYFSKETKRGVREALARARHGRAWNLMREVLYEPGLKQTDLAERVGMTRKILRPNLELLIEAGLIVEKPSGRKLQYFPGPKFSPEVWKEIQQDGSFEVPEVPGWLERRLQVAERGK